MGELVLRSLSIILLCVLFIFHGERISYRNFDDHNGVGPYAKTTEVRRSNRTGSYPATEIASPAIRNKGGIQSKWNNNNTTSGTTTKHRNRTRCGYFFTTTTLYYGSIRTSEIFLFV